MTLRELPIERGNPSVDDYVNSADFARELALERQVGRNVAAPRSGTVFGGG